MKIFRFGLFPSSFFTDISDCLLVFEKALSKQPAEVHRILTVYTPVKIEDNFFCPNSPKFWFLYIVKTILDQSKTSKKTIKKWI